jgi:thioredoxin-related protein
VDRLERDLAGKLQVLRLSAFGSVGRQLAARYEVRGVPTFLLFDGEGRMIYHEVGHLDPNEVKAEIDLSGR